jgi:hypothetical protein
MVFTFLTLYSVFRPTRILQNCVREICRPSAVMRIVWETTKQQVNLSVRHDDGRPKRGFRKHWRRKI